MRSDHLADRSSRSEQPADRSARSERVGGRDDTTRYLCAAAHLDDWFADSAIREFLTEPTRAVPPVAGVRAAAVLAEAVAARARRKLRDTVLVILFAGVLVTLSLSIVIAWLAIGAALLVWRGRVLPAVGGGVAAAALLGVLVLTGDATTSLAFHAALTPAAAIAVGLLVVILAVLLADEFVVWRHIEDRFLRGYPLPDPSTDALSPHTRRVFFFGAKPFLAQLHRHLRQCQRMAEPDSSDDEPLRRRPDAPAMPPLCAETLYERVICAMDSLRDAAYLGPGGRFAELLVTEQVVVAAEELIDNMDRAGDFLAGPSAAPYPLLRGQRVRELRDQPLEWARYYVRFQVETWERDFVVSAFLHLAVSDTTLYVEWTPCVLLPVKKEYRAIDATPDSPLLPVARSVGRFLTLPLTMPYRLRTACSVLRPKRRSPNALTPDMYGIAHSLRELAADSGVQNYFQFADRSRYLKVLESRLTLALVDVLDAAGYEVAGLEQQAATVANSSVYTAPAGLAS